MTSKDKTKDRVPPEATLGPVSIGAVSDLPRLCSRGEMIQRQRARKESLGLFFGEEIDGRRARQQASLGTALDQLFYRLLALFAVAESPFVHIHAYKLVG